MKTYSDFKSFSKDQAYWERNQLVAALSKVYPAWLEKHPASDKDWDDDWRTIVFIEIPTNEEVVRKDGQGSFTKNYTRQLSWHLHDSDVGWFYHLEHRQGNSWDGHTSQEKYRRLTNLKMKRWWEFWK